jgi:hypothetical protein
MHRIDGPGATVDKKFTEGDPVGGTPATVVTAAWMNDVQEELVSVLAAAGIAPVKGTQDQLLKAIRSISTGVAGASANAKMTVNVASSSATFTADEVLVKSALGSAAWVLAGFNKTINLATAGAGGMDTGAAPVSGYVALYAIYNPTSGASALLAVNATASVAPQVYGGANMPSGYTASGLLTVVPTNASSQFKVVIVRGRTVGFAALSPFSTSVAVSNSVVSISSVVPANAVEISGLLNISASTASNLGMSAASDTNQTCQQNLSLSNMVAGQSIISNFSAILLPTPQQIVVSTVVTAGTPAITLSISEYRI